MKSFDSNQKIDKNNFRKKVNLDILTLPLSDQQKARAKDVVQFLRNNKTLEQVSDFDENNFREIFDGFEEFQELNGHKENYTVDSLWDSIQLEESRQNQTRLNRLKYRDELTKNMTSAEYIYYSECSKVSFIRPYKRSKFIEWCKLETYPLSLNKDCVDVLSQLAYDLLEQVVCGGLTLSKHKENKEEQKKGKGLQLVNVIQFIESRLKNFEEAKQLKKEKIP